MEQVITFFGGHPAACVYCGAESPRRWDHLVPVRDGGETVIGNMVPACSSCDDSKQDLELQVWWEGGRKFSPAQRNIEDQAERLTRIRAYAEHFGYAPRRLEDRLTPEENVQLAMIREAASDLRHKVEGLIKMHDQRTRMKTPTQ